MACILCGSQRLAPVHVIAGAAVDRCVACGLRQLNPTPTADSIESIYGDDYYAPGTGEGGYADYLAQRTEYLATFREELRRIEAVAGRRPLRILDVGCGPGFFLEAALERGHDAYGVDIIPSIVELAQRTHPGRVFAGALDDIEQLRGLQFDVIFASHVMEHVPGPLPFTVSLAAHLRPGGLLVYVTPNIASLLARASGRRWVSFKIPEHVAYYDPRTMTDLFRRAGLRTVAIQSGYQSYRLPFVALRVRQLIRPLDRLIPMVERSRWLRDRIIRVTSGSLRGIAALEPAPGASRPSPT